MKLRDKLLIPIGLALVGVLVVNLGAMRVAVRTWEQVAEEQQQGHEQVRNLLEAEVAFKRQVQEWKNVLLRGHDPVDLAAYVDAFEQQEQRVQEGLAAYAHGASTAENRAEVQRLQRLHEHLGEQYHQALQVYRSGGPDPALRTDRLVRGQDRPLAAALATLRERTESHHQTLTQAAVSEGHWTAWGMVVAALGLTALIGLMLLSVVNHLIVQPARVASRLSRRMLEATDPESSRAPDLDDEPITEIAEAATDDELGELLQALGTLRTDLEQERSQTRQALQDLELARRSAEAADAAKATFLAAVSHELRTPLNGVVGSLQLLEGSALDEGQRQLMNAAAASSRRLATLVEDILDYTQVSGGDVELVDAPFDVEVVLNDIIGEYRGSVLSRGTTLEISAAPGGPRRVTGDRSRLRRVVSELVKNAVDATISGEILIQLTTAETAGGARVRIDVVDNGPGIPESMRDAIFEPFTQVDSGMDRRKEGAGLGLSMCQQLIAHLGGSLEYSPHTGGGSRFSLELVLPLAPQTPLSLAPTDEADALEETSAVAPPVVLLVGRADSHLVDTLNDLGVPSMHVVTLDDALLRVAEYAFEVAVVDIARVGIGSVENLRDISDSVGHLTALVASARPEARDRCLAEGWDDVLSDRASGSEVRTLLSRWLSTPLKKAS